MRTRLAALLLCGSSVAAAGPAPDTSRADEVARISALVHHEKYADRVPGYKALDFSGITDEKLFDYLRERLEGSVTAHYSELAQEQKFLVRALATSGNPKYRPALEKIAAAKGRVDDRARQWAEKALKELDQYGDWNPIINEPHHGMPWARARLENLVDFDDIDMNRAGFRRIREQPNDVHAMVFNHVEARLKALLARKLDDDPQAEDVTAWGCHTLAASLNPKYKATLEQAAENGPTHKVRSNCDEALYKLKY